MIYKYICFDGNNLYWRSFSVLATEYSKLKKKINDKKLYSGGIEIAIKNIKKIITRFGNKDSQIYLIFDNPNSKIDERKRLSGGSYKHSRDKKTVPKEFYQMLNIFQDILKNYSNNYHVLVAENCEADDLTLPLRKELKYNHRNKILWVSNDLDWARNISKFNDWYNWHTFYNEKEFFKKYKFWPKNNAIKMYKAFAGDNSDNIKKAVPYLPEKIILDIVNKFNTLDDLFFNLKDTVYDQKWKMKIQENKRQLKINYQLVDFLPISIPINNIIIKGTENKIICRVWYKILKIPLETWMMDKKEKSSDFFKKRKINVR